MGLCESIGLFCPKYIAPADAKTVNESGKTVTRQVTPEQFKALNFKFDIDLSDVQSITIEEPKDQSYLLIDKNAIFTFNHKPKSSSEKGIETTSTQTDYYSYGSEDGHFADGFMTTIETQTYGGTPFSVHETEIVSGQKSKLFSNSVKEIRTEDAAPVSGPYDVTPKSEITTRYEYCPSATDFCEPAHPTFYDFKLKRIPHFVDGKLVRK